MRRLAGALVADRHESVGIAGATCVAGLVQSVLAAVFLGLAGSGPGDVQQYGLLAKQYAESGFAWTYSLWYVLVDLSVVRPSLDANWVAASLVLQGSLYFLRGAVLVFVMSLLGFRWPIALAVSLLVGTASVFPWPGRDYYRGTFPGATYLSITQSLSTIAITLVVGSLVVYLRRPTMQRAALLGASCLLLALCKPSWVPGLAVAICALTVWRRIRKEITSIEVALIVVLVLAPAMLVVAASYASTLGSGGILSGRDLIWEPFRNWNEWSTAPFRDLFRSLAFPLSALAVLAVVAWRRSASDSTQARGAGLTSADRRSLAVAWIAFFVSLGIFLGWTEFIPGFGYPNDFNLAWGVQSSVFALNLLSAIALLRVRTALIVFPAVILIAQSASTLDYLFRVFPSEYATPS
jgi:hypothetical protein